MSFQSKIDIVLISDEEEDDASERPSTTTRPGTANTNENKSFRDQSSNHNLDDSDGRRVSRRRKNKNENCDETKDVKNIDHSRAGRSSSNSNDHVNDSSKHSTVSSSNERKHVNAENRTETRSRKRERSPSPVVADVKETESISYKEVLSGLEGAAFQSRYIKFIVLLFLIVINVSNAKIF